MAGAATRIRRVFEAECSVTKRERGSGSRLWALGILRPVSQEPRAQSHEPPETQKPRVTRGPCLLLQGRNVSDDSAAADDHPVDEQKHHRTDDRANPASGLIVRTHQSRGEESTHEGAGNTKQDRDDPATRVAAGHEELGDRANDQTKQQPSNDVHLSSSGSTAPNEQTRYPREQQECQMRLVRLSSPCGGRRVNGLPFATDEEEAHCHSDGRW